MRCHISCFESMSSKSMDPMTKKNFQRGFLVVVDCSMYIRVTSPDQCVQNTLKTCRLELLWCLVFWTSNQNEHPLFDSIAR